VQIKHLDEENTLEIRRLRLTISQKENEQSSSYLMRVIKRQKDEIAKLKERESKLEDSIQKITASLIEAQQKSAIISNSFCYD
jgi:hypothetical protein